MTTTNDDPDVAPAISTTPPPRGIQSRNPLAWLAVFGPGAIIASLTIGTGELIFSTRGGALFGYRILFLFVVISVLKWGLVLATARHMVLTGVHPYRRMLDLPGPRGWLLVALFVLALVCMPIWVSFHSSVLGNLTSWITGTRGKLGGAEDYLWGASILAAALLLTATGGYSALERVQLVIVGALVFCAGVTLILYNPDWLELIKGALIPQRFEYPEWLSRYPQYDAIREQKVWVETTRYVGVIGGAGFDYLAYTSFLRDKGWGQAGEGPLTEAQLGEVAASAAHPLRKWVRVPLIDCTISFALVVGFSAVFVASGAMFLGPNHKIPTEDNLLNLQAEFVTNIHQWLLPLYVTGAFLTMLGTLYGTIEIACSTVKEIVHAVDDSFARRNARRLKVFTATWCAAIAYGVLGWMFLHQMTGAEDKPRMLMAILTPANLFTGVLFCGLICWAMLWIDWRFMPRSLRMPWGLLALNLISGVIFLVLGMRGYWEDQSRWIAILSMSAVFALGLVAAWLAERRSGRLPPTDSGRPRIEDKN